MAAACRAAGLAFFTAASMGFVCLPAQAAAVVPVASSMHEEERRLFREARNQIASDSHREFRDTLSRLRHYPLRHFLEYEYLRKQWQGREPRRTDVSALNRFERTSSDKTLTRRLTRLLQRRLAETDQWALFLGVSKSTLAAEMPCTTLRAKHETDQLRGFDEQVVELWVKPRTHPTRCAGVLADIEKQNTPPLKAIWEKIYLAMEAGKVAHAEQMLVYLGSRDRAAVQQWIDAQSDPGGFLLSGKLVENTVLNRRMLTDLVVKWSKADTVAATEFWLSVRDNYTFFDDRRYDTHRALVMRAAYRRLPEAQQWLEGTNARSDDLELEQWRVRTSLLVEDWPAVLRNISRLPAEEQEEDHWLYWEARALEALGNSAGALSIYSELAELQSYYGFLSADRVGKDYAIYDQPIVPEPELLVRLSVEPALIRAREFKHVGLEHEARREWNNWISGRDGEEVAASAVLANHWQLHDRAIFAAGQAEQRRAISLRFPVLYRTEVSQASSEYGIEAAWIFGVMRRESAYIRDIKSGAGAVGLMQLMPRTARYVAELKGKKNWNGDLTDAGTNIGFGTFYLRHVMDRFNNHQVLATASYNAGPHRVDQWLRDTEMAADVWIDTIPFTETRRYVRAVLAYAAIYEHHLTGEPQRLADKLRTVPAAPSI